MLRNTSFVFPQVRSSKTGTTVDYVADADKSWYVLRIKYGKAQQVADALIEEGRYVYVAKVWKDIIDKETGKKRRKLIPFMNLIFAYVTGEEAEQCVRDAKESPYTTYYYDHFTEVNEGKNPPLTVSSRDMQPLIIATALQDEHVMEVDIDACNFICDEPVQVIEGPFEGLTGRYVRVSRQNRVMVYIEGLQCGIVTAYIPPCYIEKLHSI